MKLNLSEVFLSKILASFSHIHAQMNTENRNLFNFYLVYKNMPSIVRLTHQQVIYRLVLLFKNNMADNR